MTEMPDFRTLSNGTTFVDHSGGMCEILHELFDVTRKVFVFDFVEIVG
jgi:hypothetical protein